MSRKVLAFATLGVLSIAASSNAAVILDNFNTNLGHMGYAPNFSGTTVGEDATSSNVFDNTTTVDGGTGGSAKITLVHDATTTNWRVRFLSGGPAYNSTNGGNPAANTTFTTSSGTDGFIGFYLKTTTTGWKTSINLDDSTNTAAGMDGSLAKDVIADGDWHLYEWSLDSTTDWGAVSGIGGGHSGALVDGQHSIDSIYFTDGTTANSVINLDFVAKSDSGTVGALVPEPASLSLLGLGALGLVARRRRA